MKLNTKVTPWIGFESQAEEAAAFYTSLIPDSRILSTTKNPDDGKVLVVEFELGGLPVFALNSGQPWKHTEAFSLSVACDNQEELDRIWDALADGGEEVQCSWVVDRFGVHWQVVPAQLAGWITSSDTERVGRVLHAVWSMVKLDIATLQAAWDGDES